MSKSKKDKRRGISPEKMAILAEKGIKAAKLTKEEKQYLLNGLKEIYDIWDFKKQSLPPLESEAVDEIMNKFFQKQPKLWIRFSEKIIEIVKQPTGLYIESSAFAHRGIGTESISFYKKAGKLTVHLEIVRRDERLADIHIRLTDDSGIELTSFEVALFKGERCVETVSTIKSNTISLSAIKIGDYMLKVSDSKGELTSIFIRIGK
jgi:hypothetical protein